MSLAEELKKIAEEKARKKQLQKEKEEEQERLRNRPQNDALVFDREQRDRDKSPKEIV